MSESIWSGKNGPPRFSLKRRTLLFVLEDEDAGGKKVERTYSLRALDGLGRDTYVEAVQAGVEFNEDGTPKVGTSSMRGLKSLLLSLSVFDDAGKAVPQSVIDSWPVPTIDALFEGAQELSALSSSAATAVGNG